MCVRVGGAGRSSWGADGRAWFVVVSSCRRRVVGRARLLGAVFFDVRFGRWGAQGRVDLA